MKITITGLPGSGSTTVGKLLAQELGYEFCSSGALFRQMAAEHRMPIHVFDEFVSKNLNFDREFDARQNQYGSAHENFVMEGRLSWRNVPDALKVKLSCNERERTRRVAERDNCTIDEALDKSATRERTYRERYQPLYGLDDFMSDMHFDLVIDSTTLSPAQIVSKIVESITACRKRTSTVAANA